MHVLITLQAYYWACFILVGTRPVEFESSPFGTRALENILTFCLLHDLGLRTNLMNPPKLRALEVSCFEGPSSEQLLRWRCSVEI